MPQKNQQSRTSGAVDTQHEEQPSRTIETETDTFENPEALSPLSSVMLELEAVAEGGSMVQLRTIMRDVMPTDKEKARAFVHTLITLRKAAEATASLAQDTFYAVHGS